jgi:hypothetical protein
MFPPGSRRLHSRAAPRVVEPDAAEGVPREALILPDEPLPRREPEPPPQAVDAPLPHEDRDLGADEASRMTESDSSFEEALIHPDTPIVRTSAPRTAETFEQVVRGAAEEAVVTGIGEAPRWERALDQLAIREGDPDVAELTRMVRKLSDGLSTRGEVALKATPDLTPFEATLRAYCVGFLSRAREGRDR